MPIRILFQAVASLVLGTSALMLASPVAWAGDALPPSASLWSASRRWGMAPDEIAIAVEEWKSGGGNDSALIQDSQGSTVLIAPWWGRELTLFDMAGMSFRRLPTSVPCGRARFGRDGQILCWQAQPGVHALDARTGVVVRRYSAVSPEDQALAKRYDDANPSTSRRLEKAGDKQVLAKEKVLDDYYHAVVLTSDGTLLAAAGPTKTLRVWDGPTGRLLGDTRLPETARALHLSNEDAVLEVETDGAGLLRFQLPSLAALPRTDAGKVGKSSPKTTGTVQGRTAGDVTVYGLEEGIVVLRRNKDPSAASSLVRFVSSLPASYADARVLSTKKGQRPLSVDISPEGQIVAIATRENTSLYSTRDGKVIGRPLPEGRIYFGGSFLFIEGNKTTRRYTAATGAFLDERKLVLYCQPVIRLEPLVLECPNKSDVAEWFRWDTGKAESTYDPKRLPERLLTSRTVRVGQYSAEDEGPPLLQWQFLSPGGRKGEISAARVGGGNDPLRNALLAESILLVGQGDETTVVNLETAKVITKIPFSIAACTLSGDGRTLVRRAPRRYEIWRIEAGAKVVKHKEILQTWSLDVPEASRGYHRLLLDEKGETMLVYDDEGNGRTLVFDLR